ncbi:MAG: NAD(P)-dependent oxidoreductase, partial [Dehalococcoidia bacterium]
MAQRIGFIGLGIMGRPMAKNLLKAGFAVTAYNRSRPALEEVVAAGAQAAGSPKEAAAAAEVVITIVTDSPDVEQVILGPEGVIEGVRPGTAVIDMSTISPQVTSRIAARLAEAGASMLDAPVSGGQWGAEAGTLSIMVGGDEEAFRRCLPVLEAMGKKIVHCGPSGMGQMMKLCNQIVVGINNLAMAEAIVFANKTGLDLDKMVEVITAGAASSWAMANLAPRAI